MNRNGFRVKLIYTLAGALCLGLAGSRSETLPEGFEDHGPAAPVGRQTPGGSAFAVEDAGGNRIVFVKLLAGGQAYYLFIDAETGETEQIHPGVEGGSGARVVLASGDKVYDTVGGWFLEIDVSTREVRRLGRIAGHDSRAYTVGPDGVIYAGIVRSGALVSYNPATGKYTDHGPINEEDWSQYPRPIVADEDGWIYVGIAQKLGQVVGYHPATGERRAYIPEADRQRVGLSGEVHLGEDGKVYAHAPGWGWHRLVGGEATPVDEPAEAIESRERYTIHGTSDATRFPDGSRFRLSNRDLVLRRMEVWDAGAEEPREVGFDYESPGVRIYSMVAGPDGRIYGATGNPLHVWRFDPATGEISDWPLGGGHLNELVRQGSKLYGAKYSQGSIYEFDPSNLLNEAETRVRFRSVQEGSYGYQGNPDMVGRPYAMLAHSDGRHVVMGGNPARVEVGGGLLIVDVERGGTTALLPEDLVPDQGVMALAELPDGDLIVGSTTAAATAGVSEADEALLYRLDWETYEVTGRWKPDPAPREIRDLIVAGDGLVYGLDSGNRFFVFDPEAGEFVHDEEVADYGGLTGGQAPRTMALGPDGGIYVLFRDAIARVEPDTFLHREIGRPGMPIDAGIVIHEGRLYFVAAESLRLFSYDLNRLR